ncbi:DUF63 family protein [Candidatus Micrarchaeota archaeon]|nr:DUF63 family protein [Candidatus Micrarchaeota archaeon]MBU1165884.1 DUF63 family protein [Candidatus Micrarchaeota archaeon]MBU1886994.1 DUF63 family protein [Candidatus Micrarchaeota archaeon]
MENFIYEYYIAPIWDHSGYNLINTLTYAIIAIIAVYFIYGIIKKKMGIEENFIKGVLAFVLFGSTLRVVTDSIDSHVLKPVSILHQVVLDSHLWDYGYLTVSPGVYILTAMLLLISMAILYKMKRMELLQYVGLGLWLPHFILLVPFMTYAVYAIPIIILAMIPAYLAYRYFKDTVFAAIVGAQALDGAATFFAIDIFPAISGVRYFEQHVFSSAIGEIAGTYFVFYLIKVGIAAGAAYVLTKEKMDQQDKYFVALMLIIMGLAPGIRDILRMVIAG